MLAKVLFLTSLIIIIKESATKEDEVFSHFLNTDNFNGMRILPVECEHLPEETDKRFCRYRDEGLFPFEYWNWKAGHGCYWYLNPSWFKKKIYDNYSQILQVGQFYYDIPYGMTQEGKRIGFDYTNPNYVNEIYDSFASDVYFLKWKNCAEDGYKCCSAVMHNKNICPNEFFPCPTTWDAWSCYSSATRDSLNEQPCPDYVFSTTNLPCILNSQKECFSNGTWNHQTDYGTCAVASVYRHRHTFHIIVLYVSIALSFPAVIIFIAFKKLRILRVNLHRNLLIVCIIRCILTIMSKEIVLMDSLKPSNETNNVLHNNGVPCRILAYFTSVANNAIYACMLMDGFYLHKLIVRIFSDDPNIYIMYIVTTVLSFVPTTIWAILMAIEADENCWMADGSWYQWIPDGFRIAILALNIILLFDIIRALLSKLKKNVSAQHTKYSYILLSNGKSYISVLRRAYISTLKAMGFLIPLFGVPFIITANRNIVDMDSCSAGDIYYYVSYSVQALQGIMVALLFCYANKEVHIQIKTACKKFNLQIQSKFGSKNGHRTPPNRRDTAATYVHNNSVAPAVKEDPKEFKAKVEDWLTQKRASESQGALSLEPIKNQENATKGTENNTDGVNETNTDKKEYYDRISKFIDDSFESLNNFDSDKNSEK